MQKISKMLSKVDLSDNFKYPAYSSDSMNNGIIGYTNKPEFICSDTNPVYITFGDHTITFNIAKKSFSVLDNVKVLLPLLKNKDEKILLFIISIWKKLIPNLGYSRHWKVAKKCMLKLPIKDENLGDYLENIDFKFMEDFIAELEAQRIAELEAYLITTNLKNYNLTIDEKQALKDFENLEWQEFKIQDLFSVKSYKKRFDANKVTLINNGGFPYIVRTALNNGLKGFIDEDDIYLNSGNTISFGQDTATIFYQENSYFTGDKIKILEAKFNKFYKNNAQFFIISMNKSFLNFSWGSSSFSEKIINNQSISLPIKNKNLQNDINNIDFNFIENFIKAIEKLVIKDVVDFADEKISLTKKCIKTPCKTK